jgi:hypothetical protein
MFLCECQWYVSACEIILKKIVVYRLQSLWTTHPSVAYVLIIKVCIGNS